MTSKELQVKFNKLTEELQLAKIDKARLEDRLEQNKTERADLVANLLKVTGTKTVEEAKQSLDLIRTRLEEKIEEATKLLGE